MSGITRPVASLTVWLILACLVAAPASAQREPVPTRVLVRAVSQDAKVLHDGVGGAEITIREVATGNVLASGIQKGTSGNTESIMEKPRERGAAVYDVPGTAGFLATLALERPTQVEIVARGPLGSPQAIQRASKTMLLVPGKHVLGEGVLLTIHGFIVDILAPERDALQDVTELPVRATVTMSCGCPTEPGGLWDANKIDLVARLVRNNEVVVEAPLRYAGERSTYEVSLPVPDGLDGPVMLEVLAMDASQANFGMDRLELHF